MAKKYDSKFERRLAEGPLSHYEYHPKNYVDYTWPAVKKQWQPDFQYGRYLIECKGRFRTRDEACKYKHINTALKNTKYQLVFLLERKNVPFPGAKKRKDGSKKTVEEWLTSQGIPYYYEENIEKLLEDLK